MNQFQSHPLVLPPFCTAPLTYSLPLQYCSIVLAQPFQSSRYYNDGRLVRPYIAHSSNSINSLAYVGVDTSPMGAVNEPNVLTKMPEPTMLPL